MEATSYLEFIVSLVKGGQVAHGRATSARRRGWQGALAPPVTLHSGPRAPATAPAWLCHAHGGTPTTSRVHACTWWGHTHE